MHTQRTTQRTDFAEADERDYRWEQLSQENAAEQDAKDKMIPLLAEQYLALGVYLDQEDPEEVQDKPVRRGFGARSVLRMSGEVFAMSVTEAATILGRQTQGVRKAIDRGSPINGVRYQWGGRS